MAAQSNEKYTTFADATTFKAAQPGISREESTAVYESWASAGTYEQEMSDDNYGGHKAAAEATADFFPSDRESKLILDLASGTGLVGAQLRKLGFRRLHGLDPSQGMLDIARQRNIYEKDFCCYLDSNPLPMDSGTYDGAVSSGGMCEGHIPTAGLRQLTRVIKSGGLVCIVMRENFLEGVADYKGKLEDEMAAMEKEGVWRLVARKTFPRYFYDYSGVVFTFQTC